MAECRGVGASAFLGSVSDTCSWNSISQLRGVTCHIASHSVTYHATQVNTLRLNVSHARFTYRGDGRLSWPMWLVTIHTQTWIFEGYGGPVVPLDPSLGICILFKSDTCNCTANSPFTLLCLYISLTVTSKYYMRYSLTVA